MTTDHSQTMTIDVALQQAVTHHQAGRLQDAEQLYRAILQVQPTHSDANHNLGILAIQVHKADEGIPYFKAALESNQKQGQYWLSYIDALIQAGQDAAAREVLGQARQFGLQGEKIDVLEGRLTIGLPDSKNNAKLRFNKSEKFPSRTISREPSQEEMSKLAVLFNQGNYAEAESLSYSLTERFPQHGFGWKVLGAVLHKFGRIEASLQAKRKATEMQPDDAEAHNNLGNSLREHGRLTEAEGSLRKALELKPDYAEAYNNLGMTLYGQGRFSEAEICYRYALELKPDYVEAHKNLGNNFLRLKNVDMAVVCYENAISFAPNYDAPFNNLGAIYYSQGNVDQAVVYYRKAHELNLTSAGALHNLGVALYQQGSSSAAIDCFTKALSCVHDNWVVDSAAYLAVLYYLQDDLPRVSSIIERFIGIMPRGDEKLGTYLGYLNLMMAARERRQEQSVTEQGDLLYVIGESHSLAAHGTVVRYRGREMCCAALWIAGCKQWHLGNRHANIYKYKFEAYVASLPHQSTILLTIGEIDCRSNEGIIKAWEKYPDRSLEEMAQITASAYVAYIERIAARYDHRWLLGGVPAINIKLEKSATDTVVRLIRTFNAILKELALSAGMDFLDVYALTDRGDGIASEQWHIDDTHLLPSALVEAFARQSVF
jgi:tetratricopeptide (TPR) repeat protein